MPIIPRYSTFESVANTFNKDIQALLLTQKDKAYLSNVPTLNYITEHFGYKNTLKWLDAQWISIKEFTSVALNGNSEELSRIVANKYSFLKVTEIHLFLAKFKAGEFGKFYGTFDPLVLSEALIIFMQKRAIEIDYVEKKAQMNKPQRAVCPKGYSPLEWNREVKKRAKTDIEAFKMLFPKLPTERPEPVYWRAWRLFEQSIGKYLCEFNIKNK